MKNNDPFQPQLRFTLGDKLTVRFKTPADISAWVNEEYKQYSNIMPPAASQDQAIGQLWNQVSGWFQQFNQQQQVQLNNAGATTEHFKQPIENLLNKYTSGNLVYSQSTWGLYIAQLATSEPQLAARVLILLGNFVFALNSAQQGNLWLRAGAISEGLRRGWIDQKPVADIGLQKFRQDWENNLLGVEATFQGKVVESAAVIESIKDDRKSWQTHLMEFSTQSAEALNKTRTDTDEVLTKSHADIEHFKQTYNAALALRAPTQYWAAKGETHRYAAFGWLGGFLLLALLGVAGCWFVWHETVEAIAKEATYTAYLPTIGAAALAAWFLRICSRQSLSNFGLSADAGERVAMVKTYLALSEGGHATDAERGLILAALFRPSTRLTDDAAPPTWFDLISKDKH